MKQYKTKILFVHNIMAPYRLPIFSQLSKIYDLKLLFIRVTHDYRRWKVSQDELEFKYVVSRSLTLFAAKIPLDIFHELSGNPYEIVIVGEGGAEMIPACLISLFYKFVKHNKIILMSERFEIRDARVQDRFVKRAARVFFDAYLRFVYRRCDAFVACSTKAADYLRYVGVEDDKIFKSVQAVFNIQKSPHEVMKQKDEDIVTILIVAYFEDRKGLDKLIKAFMALHNANTKLIIAGDGAIRQKLEAMASGNNNIIFVGHVDGVEKRDLYETADIFVLPSHFETWGLVVNEAMHHGLPVVITDTMGSTDLIDGNGIIVPAGDLDALVHALKGLVENREMRNKMSKRSREIISLIDLNAVTEPFINAIGYVLGQKP